ncbi:MAG: DUF4012 domain-containing protein, partial [Chloroflexota bacterium]|nr:DUF4012 domain-containing protein [Chloroflexota bacterium]
LLIVLGSIVSGLEYRTYAASYQRDQVLAQEGMQHLLKVKELLNTAARNPLDASNIAKMQYEFAAAIKSLTQVNTDLKTVPGAAQALPIYGTRLHAALHLVSLSLALSQAGVAGCDILNLLLARLYTRGQAGGITAADLAVITQRFRDIQASLAVVTHEMGQLQPSDMQTDPRIGKLVDTLRNDMPTFQLWLDGIGKVLPLAPALLGIGAPANYFVEVLDSTELRPGGGFIGNYGTVTLSGGLLTDAHITDTDLLDHPFAAAGMSIPFPPQYSWFDIAKGNWSVRDSNLDADFPTVARAAESNYVSEGGDVPLQGVFAITPTFIQHALAITGPIAVPEYNETINAQNLIERIHYYQLGPGAHGPDDVASPDGHSSLRKHFTALLAEHFLARVRQIATAHIPQFIRIVADAVQTKDLQLYFNAPAAETLLHNAGLDASIQTAPGDNLFIVDANIGADKANSQITNTLNDDVTLDMAGDALHHTTLRYAWTTPGQVYGSPLYRDYARVYVPRRSVLQTQDGWQPQTSNDAFGHKVWAGFFTLQYGETRTITLDWRVPHAAIYDGHGWHYEETIQRQAGTIWSVHEQVQLPSCATVTNVTGGIEAAGDRVVILNQELTKNTTIAIDYSCSF